MFISLHHFFVLLCSNMINDNQNARRIHIDEVRIMTEQQRIENENKQKCIDHLTMSRIYGRDLHFPQPCPFHAQYQAHQEQPVSKEALHRHYNTIYQSHYQNASSSLTNVNSSINNDNSNSSSSSVIHQECTNSDNYGSFSQSNSTNSNVNINIEDPDPFNDSPSSCDFFLDQIDPLLEEARLNARLQHLKQNELYYLT